MKKIHYVSKVLLQFENIFFVIFNTMAESMNCSLVLKNLEDAFLQRD